MSSYTEYCLSVLATPAKVFVTKNNARNMQLVCSNQITPPQLIVTHVLQTRPDYVTVRVLEACKPVSIKDYIKHRDAKEKAS